MIEITVSAITQYVCKLDPEDEAKVISYAKRENVDIEEAVCDLYDEGAINLYRNSTESDFFTQSIDMVEVFDID